jgi:hypothetical protein
MIFNAPDFSPQFKVGCRKFPAWHGKITLAGTLLGITKQAGLPDFFLSYPNRGKYTKMPNNYQSAIKYTKGP